MAAESRRAAVEAEMACREHSAAEREAELIGQLQVGLARGEGRERARGGGYVLFGGGCASVRNALTTAIRSAAKIITAVRKDIASQ